MVKDNKILFIHINNVQNELLRGEIEGEKVGIVWGLKC